MKYVLVLSLSNLDFICLERISLHGEYICAWEIPRKVVFLEIILHWFKCTNYSLYDIKKYFQKYKWKYHLSAVLGKVIKCPKGTGSAWETLHNEKLCFLPEPYFLQAIYLQCSTKTRA